MLTPAPEPSPVARWAEESAVNTWNVAARARAAHALIVALAVVTIAAPRAARAAAADSLSAAAREARRADDKVRPVMVKPADDANGDGSWDFLARLFFHPGEEGCARTRVRHRFLEGWAVGPVARSGFNGHGIAPSAEYGLRVTKRLEDPGLSGEVDVVGGPLDFTGQTVAGGAFDRGSSVALEASLRGFPVLWDRVLPVGGVLGARLAMLSWRYRHAVLADDGTALTLVGDDDIASFTPYAGLALTFIDSPRGRLGASLLFGATFYGDRTDAGFRNDVFRTTGFARLEIDTRFPF